MRIRCPRLVAALVVSGLLAPVAAAAPSGGRSWWTEVWQLLADLRPVAWLDVLSRGEEGRHRAASEATPRFDKEGAGYDPSGQTPPPPPPPTSGTP